MCQREAHVYELFDSLGTTKKQVEERLLPLSGECVFNETSFQDEKSVACGYFTVFYAIQRYFNEDLELLEILEDCFSHDLAKNEEKVKRFLSII